MFVHARLKLVFFYIDSENNVDISITGFTFFPLSRRPAGQKVDKSATVLDTFVAVNSTVISYFCTVH